MPHWGEGSGGFPTVVLKADVQHKDGEFDY